MTTWHVWRGEKLTLGCGSCGKRIMQGQTFARVHVPLPPDRPNNSREIRPAELVRCESCYERFQVLCPWPRQERTLGDEGFVAPAPLLPNVMLEPTFQPFARARRKWVEDHKARQMKDAS